MCGQSLGGAPCLFSDKILAFYRCFITQRFMQSSSKYATPAFNTHRENPRTQHPKPRGSPRARRGGDGRLPAPRRAGRCPSVLLGHACLLAAGGAGRAAPLHLMGRRERPPAAAFQVSAEGGGAGWAQAAAGGFPPSRAVEAAAPSSRGGGKPPPVPRAR